MNKELLQKVVDKLNTIDDDQFSMLDFFFRKNGCKSPSCIAGWAIELSEVDSDFSNLGYVSGVSAWLVAADICGIDYDTAHSLFIPTRKDYDGSEFYPYAAKPKEAARVVQHLIDTGIVDWSMAHESNDTDQ